MSDLLSRAHQPLASGQLDEARVYLEELLRQDAENTDLLYDLARKGLSKIAVRGAEG